MVFIFQPAEEGSPPGEEGGAPLVRDSIQVSGGITLGDLGAMAGVRKGRGLTGTVELTDDEGSVAVVDVAGGRVQGLDIVI